MKRHLLPCLTLFALLVHPFACAAQTQGSPADAPEPKMPPMPSMEGQQGDVSKPVTQIPARKKVEPPAAAARTKTRQPPARRHPVKAAHRRR